MYILNEINKMVTFENKIDITLGLHHIDKNIFDHCSYFVSNRELNTIKDYKDYENYRTTKANCILNDYIIDKMINLLSFQNYEFNGKKSELLDWLHENGIYMESRNIKNWFIYTRKKGSK